VNLEDQLAALIVQAERKTGKAAREKAEKKRWSEHWDSHADRPGWQRPARPRLAPEEES
jgi:hypothetical protein